MNKNVIKDRGFHVNEDFYEALINGLQCERDKEKNYDKKRDKNILSTYQQRFLKKVTSPIILNEMSKSGFLENYMQFRHDNFKKLKISEYQKKTYQFLKFYQEQDAEVQEVYDDTQTENKRFSLMKLYSLYRTFRRIYGLYDLYKTIEEQIGKIQKTSFDINEYDLNNPLGYEKMKNDFMVHINNQSSYLVNVLKVIMSETTLALVRVTDRVFTRINTAIYSKIAEMVVQAIAENAAWQLVGLFLDSTGIGSFIGVGMHTAGATRAAIWGRKINKFISEIRTVAQKLYKLSKSNKLAAVAGKTATKLVIGGARLGISAYNIVSISDLELQEIERLIHNEVQRRTLPTQHKLRNKMVLLQRTKIDFSKPLNKIQNKIQNKADDLFLEPTDYSFISEKYRREITIDGLDTSELAKTLGKLGHFFQFFWKSIDLKEFKERMKKINSFVKLEKTGFSSDGVFDIIFKKAESAGGKKTSWWDTSLVVKLKNKEKENYTYYFNYLGKSVYVLKDGQVVYGFESQKNERDIEEERLSLNPVSDDDFERIYTDGVETGFRFKFRNTKYKREMYGLVKHQTLCNLNDPKWKIINNTKINENLEGVVKILEDGQLVIDLSKIILSGGKENDSKDINIFLRGKSLELEEEKKFNENIRKIQEIIIDKLVHKDEDWEKLRDDVMKLITEKNSIRANKTVFRDSNTRIGGTVKTETIGVSNYDSKKMRNSIDSMSSQQLYTLKNRLQQVQGIDLQQKNEMRTLNDIIYDRY